jgi:hypothetical protein
MKLKGIFKISIIICLIIIFQGCAQYKQDIRNTPTSTIPINTDLPISSSLVSPTMNEPLLNLKIENANFSSFYFVANTKKIFYLQNDRLCSANIDGTNIKVIDEGCKWNGLALDVE